MRKKSNIEKEKEKKTPQEYFYALSPIQQEELLVDIRYKIISNKRICAKYGISGWALDNMKDWLLLKHNERNDAIINDYNSGLSIQGLMKKYNLHESRVRDILNYCQTIENKSKELF